MWIIISQTLKDYTIWTMMVMQSLKKVYESVRPDFILKWLFPDMFSELMLWCNTGGRECSVGRAELEI